MQLSRSTPRFEDAHHAGLIPGDVTSPRANKGRPEAPRDPILVWTKTQIPGDSGDTLRRERLGSLSKEVRQRLLTLVMAPPGCGKTTLARQWASQFARQGTHVAWLTIDAEDDDPHRFLRYLCQTVAQANCGHNTSGASLTHSSAIGADDVSAMINRVAECGDELVLVLDNYGWITNAQIHRQMSYVLDNAPANLHVIILTSAPPPLKLAHLRARNRLLELNSNDIRFNRAETLDLLQQSAGPLVPPTHLEEIHRLTHGWAVAVRIIAQSIGTQGYASSSNRGIIDCRTFEAIDDYLDELFASYPEELVDMMVDTSIVEAVSIPLCQALTERSDTESCLCQLARQQVLIPVDAEQRIFAYPALVRRYFYKKLIRQGPRRMHRLHRRAYRWYSQNERWDCAIDQALACGDTEIAAGWMASHAMAIVKTGNLGILVRWHRESAPFGDTIPQRARFAFAWAHALSHSFETALELVASIEAPHSPHGPLSPADHAECDAIRAAAYALADNIDKAIEYSTNCSSHSFADRWMASVVANVVLYCRFRTCSWAAFFAESTILDSQREEDINNHILRLSVLGLAGLLRGQLGRAEKYCIEALQAASPVERDNNHLHFSAWPTGLLANIYYETGRFDDLEALLSSRLGNIASSGYLDCTMGAFLCAARTASKRGNVTKALAILEQAEGIAVKRKWRRLEAAVVLERMRLFLHEDQHEEAFGCHRRLAQLEDTESVAQSDSPVVSTRQFVTIANALLAIHLGRAEEAVAPLQELLVQFSHTGNELYYVRVSTLLSIALMKSGRSAMAARTFKETMERATKSGFISSVVDQGTEVGLLLTHLSTNLRDGEIDVQIRQHCERMLNDNRLCVAPSMTAIEEQDDAGRIECTLTPKEHQVLTLIAHGQSNKEIARNLNVAPETIKTHLKNIFGKLAVDRRIQAVAKAQSLGLLARVPA